MRFTGLHIRTPQGVRLENEEMIAYYSGLIHSLGGSVLAYYLDGIAVFYQGVTKSFMEDRVSARQSAFYMVDGASDKRHPEWPLDSISMNRRVQTYFADAGNKKYNTTEENIILGEYRKRLVAFLVEALKL